MNGTCISLLFLSFSLTAKDSLVFAMKDILIIYWSNWTILKKLLMRALSRASLHQLCFKLSQLLTCVRSLKSQWEDYSDNIVRFDVTLYILAWQDAHDLM